MGGKFGWGFLPVKPQLQICCIGYERGLGMRHPIFSIFSRKDIALMAISIAVSVGLSWFIDSHSARRVVEFDMKYAISYYSNQVAASGMTDAQKEASGQAFANALPEALAQYAAKHHEVILVSPAVASGANNVT